MCGRFAQESDHSDLSQVFEAVPSNDLPVLPDYNICPTQQVITIISRQGRRMGAMRWGFLPTWYKTPTDGPLLINARSETIAEKPAFRGACRQRRCLIPASGFYEWMRSEAKGRQPWYIHRRDKAQLAFAGVWQSWGREGERQPTCAIVTTAANKTLAGIHHRMPVVLEPADWGLWLGEEGPGAARLMRPAAEDVLGHYAVGGAVNANRATGAALIAPLSDEGQAENTERGA